MDDYVQRMLDKFSVKFKEDDKQEKPAGNNLLEWYVDASFAVHPDFKSHTGGVMTMGGGAIQAMSKKQKLNSRSSTHAELIGVDDAITQVLWTRMFMEE
ncbi:unnamed protein product [Cylindrotheca closterium]|uniref:Uncharacterized protein n=1 Tax=Cylindrotheca closterium TaxID=2856 RepID=A0AAD2PV26_9STRA|nr:unnamed protein product [Cylindrotheca closterium]